MSLLTRQQFDDRNSGDFLPFPRYVQDSPKCSQFAVDGCHSYGAACITERVASTLLPKSVMPRLGSTPFDVIGDQGLIYPVQERSPDLIELEQLLYALLIESHGFRLSRLFSANPVQKAL
jgi:hypothetical protein